MRICFILLFFIQGIIGNAQTFLPFAAGTSGNTSWSIGEQNINTISSQSLVITQGFQQPEIDEPTDRKPPGIACFNGITTTSTTGQNDAFRIEGLGRYSSHDLIIVSQWGDLLFQSNNYQNDWNGTDQDGTPLPQGTYYYVLKIPDFSAVKGSIHVIR